MQPSEIVGLLLIAGAGIALANRFFSKENQGKNSENQGKNDNFQAYSASELAAIERLKEKRDQSKDSKESKDEVRTITRDDAFAAVNTLVLYFGGLGNEEGLRHASECGRSLFPLVDSRLSGEPSSDEIEEEVRQIEAKLAEVKS